MEAWKHLRAVLLLPVMVLVVIPGTILWLRGPDTFSLGRSVPATHDNPLPIRLQGFQPKLPYEDFNEAVRSAQEEFNQHWPAVIVDSWKGGAGAMKINSGDNPLVLLCRPGRSPRLPRPPSRER
jgi:hypothetical protein